MEENWGNTSKEKLRASRENEVGVVNSGGGDCRLGENPGQAFANGKKDRFKPPFVKVTIRSLQRKEEMEGTWSQTEPS